MDFCTTARKFETNNGDDMPLRTKNQKSDNLNHGKIVIALEIGTKNMGYAFSCYSRKNKIYTAKNTSSQQRNRMPTALLLNDDLSLNSVGFTAVSCHSNLLLKTSNSKHLYFKNLKIQHFEHGKVDSECCFKVSKEDISYHLMEVLRRNALETAQKILFCEKEHFEENIDWVLITPELTKEVVLRAAKKAKLGRIYIVPESEAAAWYCQRTQLKITSQNEITNMLQGHKFAVADLGAGKTSICVYEIKSDGTLDAIHSQFLFNVGGNSVNDVFEHFMKTVCGSRSWDCFKTDHAYDYEKLMYSFEDEKVKVDCNTKCSVITLPQNLLRIIEKYEKVTLTKRIEEMDKLLDKAELIHDKLFIYQKQIEDFFKLSYQKILDVLRCIRQNPAVADLDELVLVGGYSSSMFIRTKLKEECHSLDIAFAQDPEMVVLKGAVMIGLENRHDLFKCSPTKQTVYTTAF